MAASNKIQLGYIESQDGVQFEIDAGTAAAPGLVFDDSAATGLYSPGTGQLAFSTSSKQTALRILADGKVGVDCSPTVAFEVNGTIKASAIDAPIEGTLDDWIVHAGDTNTKIGFSAPDTFQVHTGGLARLTVTDSAVTATNAIILAEDNAIHFRGATDSDKDAILRASAGGGQLLINSRNDTILNIDSNDDSTDAHFAVSHGAATNSSTELFRVQEDGQIGVNNATPDAWHSTYKSVQIYDAAVLYGSTDDSFVSLGANHFLNTSGDFKYSNTDFASRFYQVNGGFHFESVASGTAGNTIAFSEKLHITRTGDFGTNGVTPTTQSGRVFHLHAGANQQRLHMTNSTTGVSATDGFEIIVEQSANTRIRNFEAGDMAFDTGGANNEVMRITSQANLNIGATTGLSNFASFRHINVGNNLIINAGTNAGGFTGFQNNAYVNTSGNWVRIRDDHTSSIGMDDGVFYFRHAGAGTGNISWKYPLTIEATGRLITQTDQSTTGLVIQNTTHDSILRIEAQAANKNSTIHFADGADGDVGKIDYDHNNNQLSFTVNTAQRMWFDNSNGLYVSGANHSNLEVRSNNASTKATLQTVQDSEVRFGATSDHPLAIYAGLNQRAYINTSGNMGVGIGDPSQARLVAQSASGTQIAAIKDNTGASISLGGVTQPRALLEAGASASDFVIYTATGSSWGSAGWIKRLTIDGYGQWRTHNAASTLRSYPLVGGTDIGTGNAEVGQFNYADVMSPSGDIGGWVYLGADYHGAHPYPVKAYKIAKHEPGNNGTRVYQIWHDGDSNHHYGGLWEVRLNSWGGADSNNYFTSATISCVHGMADDIYLLCYKSTDGIWVKPSTIWGGLYIRRSGWDGSGRDRGSSYCAVKNGGALASGDVNGMGGSIPGSVDKTLYPIRPSGSLTYYGGRDIEDGNDFYGG